MKFHIIGNGENVEDILKGYDLSIDELKNENKHIRVWDKLIPGTKLKIPVLSENLVEDINEIEPFIEDYYPKIKIEDDIKIFNESEFEQHEINDIQETKENDLKVEQTEINQEQSSQESINNNIKINNPNDTYHKKRYITNNHQYIYPYPYYRPIIYIIPRR